VLIRFDSRGPVFFHQMRVGKKGRQFCLYKFRTMYKDAPKFALHPTECDDPRATRVGAWLRKSSFDELPQLINVIKGDMSLVGPRPEMPFIVAGYSRTEMKRLDARPGITGLWQISPARAYTIHTHLGIDLFYIRNQHVFLDIAILIRTLTAVITGIGAT